MPRITKLLATLAATCLSLLLFAPAALAVAAVDFSVAVPDEPVLDAGDVLSRASRNELNSRLQELDDQRLDARLVTIRRLDYGLSLPAFGQSLIERWAEGGSGDPILLFLIEAQNKQAAVVADPALASRLPAGLLTSTGRTTMSQPLRDGDRYRQASLDGIERLNVVLNGGEDPGPPIEMERTSLPTNVPTQEETEESNAFTWVVVLLVVGTIVPMATWWVFSR